MTPSVPRFYYEGYALFEEDEYLGELDGKPLIFKNGMRIVGVKPDAPQWAKDECEEWFNFQHNWKKRCRF